MGRGGEEERRRGYSLECGFVCKSQVVLNTYVTYVTRVIFSRLIFGDW